MTFSEARKAAGLSVSDVMRLSGYSRSSVYAFENEYEKMGVKAVEVFAAIFNIDPADLDLPQITKRERRSMPYSKDDCVIFQYDEWDDRCVLVQNRQCRRCLYTTKLWEKEYGCSYIERTGKCRAEQCSSGIYS